MQYPLCGAVVSGSGRFGTIVEQNVIVAACAHLGQAAGEIALLVLVDVGQGREAWRAFVVLRTLPADRLSDHVAQRLKAVPIAAPRAQPFQRREKLVIDADRDPSHGIDPHALAKDSRVAAFPKDRSHPGIGAGNGATLRHGSGSPPVPVPPSRMS